MRGYPHFSFWIPITLAKVYVFPIVTTFAKINLCQEAPSLRQTLAQRVQLENESVAGYAGSLRKLFARLNLPRTEWMHKFIFGLKKKISEYVILQQPDDFEKAEELALLKEAVMDENLCFSKEAPAFDAKDISQALGKVTSPEGEIVRQISVK